MSQLPVDPRPRRLIVMRHAKSSWSDPGIDDFHRPLNARGQQAAPLMGQRLQAAAVCVDLILASPATRVRETLDLLLPAWQSTAQVVWEKQLYLADTETLCQQLSALHVDWPNVMIVGHNPGLSHLVGHLTRQYVDLPTAAIVLLTNAATSWPDAMRSNTWQLTDYWTPKD